MICCDGGVHLLRLGAMTGNANVDIILTTIARLLLESVKRIDFHVTGYYSIINLFKKMLPIAAMSQA